MKNIRLKSRFTIPIFNVTVLVIVAEDVVKAWRRYPRFGDDDSGTFVAMCAESNDGGGDYALFFQTSHISADDVAHEVKHLVDYINAYIGENKRADERPAYLTGYIHKRISAALRKGKVRLNRKRKKVA